MLIAVIGHIKDQFPPNYIYHFPVEFPIRKTQWYGIKRKHCRFFREKTGLS